VRNAPPQRYGFNQYSFQAKPCYKPPPPPNRPLKMAGATLPLRRSQMLTDVRALDSLKVARCLALSKPIVRDTAGGAGIGVGSEGAKIEDRWEGEENRPSP
jgi:hypothetical protein